jgi:hypothetical protein
MASIAATLKTDVDHRIRTCQEAKLNKTKWPAVLVSIMVPAFVALAPSSAWAENCFTTSDWKAPSGTLRIELRNQRTGTAFEGRWNGARNQVASPGTTKTWTPPLSDGVNSFDFEARYYKDGAPWGWKHVFKIEIDPSRGKNGKSRFLPQTKTVQTMRCERKFHEKSNTWVVTFTLS